MLGRFWVFFTPVLLPGKSHGWRSLVGCSPWGHQESDTTERLHFHFSLSHIGEGNGTPLQRSCLENPRDGGAWWAAIYGVAQSRTWLKWLSSSSSFKHFAREQENLPVSAPWSEVQKSLIRDIIFLWSNFLKKPPFCPPNICSEKGSDKVFRKRRVLFHIWKRKSHQELVEKQFRKSDPNIWPTSNMALSTK